MHLDKDPARLEPAEGTPARPLPTWLWPALAVVLVVCAVPGIVNTSEIFYVRDVSGAFWPFHVWIRNALHSGQFPLWNPYPAYGQSAIADPVMELLFPPVLLLRLLLPEVLGFNLSVALGFPVAAVGLYLYLARTLSRPAAAFGAVAFAASGPVLSLGNLPNVAWSIALAPWILWRVDRWAIAPSVAAFAAIAALFALQVLAGEPVTLWGTAVLAVVYAAFAAPRENAGLRDRLVDAGAVVGAGITGLLLAAPQAAPLLAASSRSLRGVGVGSIDTAEWSLHPLTLLESVVPGLWGDYLETGLPGAPWLGALNSGSGPFLYSIFIGTTIVALAALGAGAIPRRRWAIFWAIVAVVGLVWALGYNTPIYANVMPHLPIAKAFRYPSKFTVFAVLAVAILAAGGWETLRSPNTDRSHWHRYLAIGVAIAIAAIVGIAVAITLSAPDRASEAFLWLARRVGTRQPEAAASFLSDSIASAAPRALAAALATASLVWLATTTPRWNAVACALLFAIAAVDLISWNSRVNPTIDASIFGEPGWVALTREHPDDRVYVAGKAPPVERGAPPVDMVPGNVEVPESVPFAAALAVYGSRLIPFCSAWRVREAISGDFTFLWPASYTFTVGQFASQDRERRTRFLTRTGVRYFLLPEPPAGEPRVVATLPRLAPLALYELDAPMPRAFLASSYSVEPAILKQTERLFDDAFDPRAEVLLVAEPPPASGTPTPPAGEPGAAIESESANTMVVRASAPAEGAFLVLQESYDHDWHVEVDGQPTELLRANGLFRAVRIASGEHAVRFAYRPRAFYFGVATSATVAAILAGIGLARRFRRRAA